MNQNEIGITERGDAALDHSWLDWVQKGKPAILITKSPDILARLLEFYDPNRKFNIIIHATITGFGGSVLEPKVPKKLKALNAYNLLRSFYGIPRVVLRIDPIIPTDKGIDVAKEVKRLAHDNPGRIRVSFIDQYPHTKKRFFEAGLSLPWDSFHAPSDLRKKAYEELGRPEICGEPDFECTGCVSKIDCETLGVIPETDNKSQRKFCACLINKKELLKSKHPCPHDCLYCYWKK